MKTLNCLLCLFLLLSGIQAQNIDPTKIDIVRDEWGVPHIFAKTDAEVAYGLAWTTCEDDFETMQWGLLAARGMLGRALGKEGAEIDFAVRFLGVKEIVERDYESEVPEDFKRILEAYVEGANNYAEKYPEELLVPEVLPIIPEDIVIGYMMSMSLMSGVDGYLRAILDGSIDEGPPSLFSAGQGSNAIAINSSKSADGNAYLAINSHQPIEGPLSWYEAHLHSEEGWNISGGLFHGGVSIFHGTNEFLGWAHTYNYDTDVVDVFKLEMHPEKKNYYKYDDEWLELNEYKIPLAVKLFKKRKFILKVKKKAWTSKFGPTLKTKNGVYALRLGAIMNVKAAEQWYRMNKAKNFSEFRSILDMQGLARMNVIYADNKDTIFSVSNGLIPKRAEGYDWTKPVPGIGSAVNWSTFYSVDELPQKLNPACGYVFNTNNSSLQATALNESYSLNDFPKDMGFDLSINNRSQRFYSLIEANEKIDYEEFKVLKYDLKYPDSLHFFNDININEIFRLDASKYPDIEAAILHLQAWDKIANVENKNAALFIQMAYKVFFNSLKDEELYINNKVARERLFVESIRESKKHFEKHFGSYNIPLGDYQRLKRGDKSLGLAGAPDVLNSVYTSPEKDGTRSMWLGESYIQLVEFTEAGSQIEAVSPYGTSAKEGSPHYDDQMEMFVNHKTRKVTLDKAEVYKNAKRIYHPK